MSSKERRSRIIFGMDLIRQLENGHCRKGSRVGARFLYKFFSLYKQARELAEIVFSASAVSARGMVHPEVFQVSFKVF